MQYILERSSTPDVFVMINDVSMSQSCEDGYDNDFDEAITDAKFLLWKDKMLIPLEKVSHGTAFSSGYWGDLPRGMISSNQRIAYTHGKYTMYFKVLQGMTECECYFSYSSEDPTDNSMTGKIMLLSYFGL